MTKPTTKPSTKPATKAEIRERERQQGIAELKAMEQRIGGSLNGIAAAFAASRQRRKPE
ncbi:hypothetical protein [Rhizobium sp. Leaf311]|uniref:hypothetical protein n=1 Tax=Rhizobium sp. Leaf311 TaxID=1736332 RepID=UPI000B06876A|nr:hypothetical protein [Rhizobium sp. Leaf311]